MSETARRRLETAPDGAGLYADVPAKSNRYGQQEGAAVHQTVTLSDFEWGR
jgi:hypothetical protein